MNRLGKWFIWRSCYDQTSLTISNCELIVFVVTFVDKELQSFLHLVFGEDSQSLYFRLCLVDSFDVSLQLLLLFETEWAVVRSSYWVALGIVACNFKNYFVISCKGLIKVMVWVFVISVFL